MSTILHLSDIHRTPDEPVSNDELLLALFADLDSHVAAGISTPDVVVISGDLTQSAEAAEYTEAEGFIRRLLEHLHLPIERLVLVPGNHDVHWPTSEETFRLKRVKPPQIDNDLVIPHSGEYLCAKSEGDYQNRLENFRAFFKRLLGSDYPSVRSEQYTVHNFSKLGFAIAALSSCDLNDHKRLGGRFHISALAAATRALAGFDGRKIAVWHHDLNWRGETAGVDFLDLDSLRQASLSGFDLALVPTRDLRDRDDRPADPRNGDLRHLREQGLIEIVRIPGYREHAVVLTDRGRDLLEANRDLHNDRGQVFHAGVGRERELEHDSQVCRAYERDADKLQAQGMEVERVRLEEELKREYQQWLHERDRGRPDADGRPDRDPREIECWAHEHDLPYRDGHVQFPDCQIEYNGSRLDASFRGELRREQKAAADAMMRHEPRCAPPRRR